MLSLNGPDGLPAVFVLADALAAGWTRRRWERGVASRTWHPLARGAWCTSDLWESADGTLRTRLHAVGHHRRRPGSVISHLSAAALHGWPLPLLPAGADHHRTWLTVPPATGSSNQVTSTLTTEVAGLGSHAQTSGPSRYGPVLTVTSPARTVVDCLRRLQAHDAVAVADAAARRGCTRAQVLEVLTEQARWPGARRAQRLLGLVDPRRESWLESVSAVAFDEIGLPSSEPQVEVWAPGGRFVARVDTLWWGLGVVGEADGWAKYDAAPDGGRRALRREKQREDALRDLGLEVVRWDVRGVVDPAGRAATVERFRRAAARADPARVTGRLVATRLPQGWEPPP